MGDVEGSSLSGTPTPHTTLGKADSHGAAPTEPAPAKPPLESEGEESEEEESEILEESPCGRWLKRREEVSYRDVPGIDCAYLAMDTEEGVEVVWNEAMFSETKKFKAQKDKLREVFDALTQIEHPNIVKFHKYWTDDGKTEDKSQGDKKPRVILITEFMSSGSLKQFLKKTKKNVRKIPLQSWKRWCTQILSALSYLHSCDPHIIHGNLTCDTIFIQHNGLVKIGSVAPDAIHKNVKTFRENIKNFHFLAPEWAADRRDRHLRLRDVRAGDRRPGAHQRRDAAGDPRGHREMHRFPGGRAAEGLHPKVPGLRSLQAAQGQGPPLPPCALRGSFSKAVSSAHPGEESSLRQREHDGGGDTQVSGWWW